MQERLESQPLLTSSSRWGNRGPPWNKGDDDQCPPACDSRLTGPLGRSQGAGQGLGYPPEGHECLRNRGLWASAATTKVPGPARARELWQVLGEGQANRGGSPVSFPCPPQPGTTPGGAALACDGRQALVSPSTCWREEPGPFRTQHAHPGAPSQGPSRVICFYRGRRRKKRTAEQRKPGGAAGTLPPLSR